MAAPDPDDHDPSRASLTARMWAYADRLMAHGHQASGTMKKRIRYPLYTLRLLIQVWRQWARDRCPQLAAGLAFQTALSLVPLIAIGLAILRASGSFGAESALVDVISKQVLPVSRTEISDHLVEWASHVSVQSFGIIGVAAMLLLAFLTASSVEHIFNAVWRSEKQRSLGQRFVVFYALITIVPTLIGVSLYHAARFGLTEGLVGAAGALASTWAALLLANKTLPNTRVHWKPAMIGALVSALLFEIAKNLFKLYVARIAFAKYSGIYGALGLLPLTLLWMYYTWLVVLFGAEVAYAIQNLPHLELLDRRARHLETNVLDKVNGQVAARLMCAIVIEWKKGNAAPGRNMLAERFELSVDVVERILRRLKEKKLIIELDTDPEGFTPGRPPAEITLADVMAPFRGTDVISPAVRAQARTPLDLALTREERELHDRLEAMNFEQLSAEAPTAPADLQPVRDD